MIVEGFLPLQGNRQIAAQHFLNQFITAALVAFREEPTTLLLLFRLLVKVTGLRLVREAAESPFPAFVIQPDIPHQLAGRIRLTLPLTDV